MIQTKRGGRAESMTQAETFDEFYARKLEALAIELKAVIKGDLPYTVSVEYACHACKGRIKLHSQGQILCLLCEEMPRGWSLDLKRQVRQILQSYPSLELAQQEWQALQEPEPTETKPKPKIWNAEFGRQIRAAREKRGLSQGALARQIFQENGKGVLRASMHAYETAISRPPEYVLDQIVQVLGLSR